MSLYCSRFEVGYFIICIFLHALYMYSIFSYFVPGACQVFLYTYMWLVLYSYLVGVKS